MSDFLQRMKDKAKADKKKIVLPEGEDERVLEAAREIASEGLADLIILGDPDKIDIDGVTVVDPKSGEKHEEYAQKFAELRAKKGVTISQETQEMIDSIPSKLAAQASGSGFARVDDYLAQSFGPCVTVEDYLNYYRMTSLAYTYAGQIQQGITVTDEEVEDFFDRHADEYAQQGINKVDQNVINVRHILVMPEKDVDSDGDGTNDQSSEQAWAAAEQSANDIYVEWQLDPTEENFAAMASGKSQDPGSTENGGMYEGVYPGQMVAEFNDWCFDPERKPGDTAIVRTSYGYHIMYFSGVGDYVYWRSVAESDTQYEKFNSTIDELFSGYDLKVDYENLHLFDIVARSIAQDAANAAEAETENGAETP